MFFTQPTCVHTEHVRTSGHETSQLDLVFPGKKGTALHTAHRKSVVKDPVQLVTSGELQLHLWSELYFHIVLDISIRTEHLRPRDGSFLQASIVCCYI